MLRWASAVITSYAAGSSTSVAHGDAELKAQLMAKLRTCPGFRYAPLAAHAQVRACRVPDALL